MTQIEKRRWQKPGPREKIRSWERVGPLERGGSNKKVGHRLQKPGLECGLSVEEMEKMERNWNQPGRNYFGKKR